MNYNDLIKYVSRNNLYNALDHCVNITETWGMPYAIGFLGQQVHIEPPKITAYDLLKNEPEEIQINMGFNDSAHSSKTYIKGGAGISGHSTVKSYEAKFINNKDYALCSFQIGIYFDTYKDKNVGCCSWGLTNTENLDWSVGLADTQLDLTDVPNFNYWPTAAYNNYVQDTTWCYTYNYLSHVLSPFDENEYVDYTDLFPITNMPVSIYNGTLTNIYLFYDKMNRKLYYGSYNSTENKWRDIILNEELLDISIGDQTHICYGVGWRTNDTNAYRINTECPDFNFDNPNIVNWLKSITI